MIDATEQRRFETAIGHVLRAGVVLSSACLALGLMLDLLNVTGGAFLMKGGIVVLIMTPAARVVLSIVEYVSERDWLFAGLTVLVLAELAASVIAALVFNSRL